MTSQIRSSLAGNSLLQSGPGGHFLFFLIRIKSRIPTPTQEIISPGVLNLRVEEVFSQGRVLVIVGAVV